MSGGRLPGRGCTFFIGETFAGLNEPIIDCRYRRPGVGKTRNEALYGVPGTAACERKYSSCVGNCATMP